MTACLKDVRKVLAILACIVLDLVGETQFATRAQLDYQHYTGEDLAQYRMVEWLVACIHPGPIRKTLFSGARIDPVVRQPIPVRLQLRAEPLEHATQRPFAYRHVWVPSDLVMWANRAVLHRGRRYNLAERCELHCGTAEDLAG